MAHLKHNTTNEIRAKEINYNILVLLISHPVAHKNFCGRQIGTHLLNLVFHIVFRLAVLGQSPLIHYLSLTMYLCNFCINFN